MILSSVGKPYSSSSCYVFLRVLVNCYQSLSPSPPVEKFSPPPPRYHITQLYKANWVTTFGVVLATRDGGPGGDGCDGTDGHGGGSGGGECLPRKRNITIALIVGQHMYKSCMKLLYLSLSFSPSMYVYVYVCICICITLRSNSFTQSTDNKLVDLD